MHRTAQNDRHYFIRYLRFLPMLLIPVSNARMSFIFVILKINISNDYIRLLLLECNAVFPIA